MAVIVTFSSVLLAAFAAHVAVRRWGTHREENKPPLRQDQVFTDIGKGTRPFQCGNSGTAAGATPTPAEKLMIARTQNMGKKESLKQQLAQVRSACGTSNAKLANVRGAIERVEVAYNESHENARLRLELSSPTSSQRVESAVHTAKQFWTSVDQSESKHSALLVAWLQEALKDTTANMDAMRTRYIAEEAELRQELMAQNAVATAATAAGASSALELSVLRREATVPATPRIAALKEHDVASRQQNRAIEALKLHLASTRVAKSSTPDVATTAGVRKPSARNAGATSNLTQVITKQRDRALRRRDEALNALHIQTAIAKVAAATAATAAAAELGLARRQRVAAIESQAAAIKHREAALQERDSALEALQRQTVNAKVAASSTSATAAVKLASTRDKSAAGVVLKAAAIGAQDTALVEKDQTLQAPQPPTADAKAAASATSAIVPQEDVSAHDEAAAPVLKAITEAHENQHKDLAKINCLKHQLAVQTMAVATVMNDLQASDRSARKAKFEVVAMRRERDSAMAAMKNETAALRNRFARIIEATKRTAKEAIELSERERDVAIAASLKDRAELEQQAASAASAVKLQAAHELTAWKATITCEAMTQRAHEAEKNKTAAMAAVVRDRNVLNQQAAAAAAELRALRDQVARDSAKGVQATQDKMHRAEVQRDEARAASLKHRETFSLKSAALAAELRKVRKDAAVSKREMVRKIEALERERDEAIAASLKKRESTAHHVINASANQQIVRAQEAGESSTVHTDNCKKRKRDVSDLDCEDMGEAAVQDGEQHAMNATVTPAAPPSAPCTTQREVHPAVPSLPLPVTLSRTVELASPAVDNSSDIYPAPKRLCLRNSSATASPLASHSMSPTATNEGSAAVSPIVAFYRDGKPAIGNRCTLGVILSQPNHWLESSHDYIQWLFPIRKPSKFAPDAPQLSDKDLRVLEADENHGLHAKKMLRSLDRMLTFYGLLRGQVGGKVVVQMMTPFRPEVAWWMAGDHNALRLMRIITSLRIFSLNKYADAVRHFLLSHPQLEEHASRAFWWGS